MYTVYIHLKMSYVKIERSYLILNSMQPYYEWMHTTHVCINYIFLQTKLSTCIKHSFTT